MTRGARFIRIEPKPAPQRETLPGFAPIDVEAGATLEERFEAFHAANPWVLDLLETMTAEMVERGRRRLGIAMLFEVLRWNYYRSTTGDEFKLNNSYRAFYSRLIMERNPEWTDVFETRLVRSEGES